MKPRTSPVLSRGVAALLTGTATIRDAEVIALTGGTVRPLLPVLAGEQSLFSADVSWQDRAVCAETDPALFHPPAGVSLDRAKRVCAGCPVRRECRDWALDTERREGGYAPDGTWGVMTWGMFGGLGPDERAGILRREHECERAAA